MHTAVISFSLALGNSESAFAKAGWRFLFTTDEPFEPQKAQDVPFLRSLLISGAGKIITVLNTLCLHANMPQIPISADHLVRNTKRAGQPPATPTEPS